MHILSQDRSELRTLCRLGVYRRGSDGTVRLAVLCVCAGAHRASHTCWRTQSEPQHLPGGGPCLAKVKIRHWKSFIFTSCNIFVLSAYFYFLHGHSVFLFSKYLSSFIILKFHLCFHSFNHRKSRSG